MVNEMPQPSAVLPADAKPWVRLPPDPGYEPDAEMVEVPTNRSGQKKETPVAELELEMDDEPARSEEQPAKTEPKADAQPKADAPAKTAHPIGPAVEGQTPGYDAPTPPGGEPPPELAPAKADADDLEISLGAGGGATPSSAPSPAPTLPASAAASTSPAAPTVNPFRRSRKAAGDTPAEGRVRIFVYGDTGSGKTLTGLSLPRPLVMDLEAGTDLYEDSFDFGVLDAEAIGGAAANDWLRLKAAVDYLIAHPEVVAEFETLVIDPITVAWEACQDHWGETFLRRRGGGKGHKTDFYDLQPGDWRHVKGDLKSFFRRLKSLPLHIVATAREKPLYAEGEMMKKVGDTFDGEKNLPYYFDVSVRLQKHPTSSDVFQATVTKSRNFFLAQPRYVYRGARGFASVVLAKIRGEDEPSAAELFPDREREGVAGAAGAGAGAPTASAASVGTPGAKSGQPHADTTDVGPVGFDGEVEIQM